MRTCVQMFAILAVACTDPAFCSPSSEAEGMGYRTTPAMADPYRYIRTGNYARILNAMSMGAGDPGHPGVDAKKVQKLRDLGLSEGGPRRAGY